MDVDDQMRGLTCRMPDRHEHRQLLCRPLRITHESTSSERRVAKGIEDEAAPELNCLGHDQDRLEKIMKQHSYARSLVRSTPREAQDKGER